MRGTVPVLTGRTHPRMPLIAISPCCSHFVTQLFSLKVPLVFFKESTPNKNLCHLPPLNRLVQKTKQNNKSLSLGLKWGIGKSWFPPLYPPPSPQTMENKTQKKPKVNRNNRQGKHQNQTLHSCSLQIRHPGKNSLKNTVFQKVARACYKNTSIIFGAEKPNIPPCFTGIFLIFLCFPESWMMLEKKRRTRQKIMLG